MKSKSTITVSLDEHGRTSFEIKHDPIPSGERSTWSDPAKITDYMMRKFLGDCENKGIKPEVEATIDTRTGHIDVTTRKKEGE